jgi:hypothetical protein
MILTIISPYIRYSSLHPGEMLRPISFSAIWYKKLNSMCLYPENCINSLFFWILFQKHVMCTNLDIYIFITITRSMLLWVLVFEGIISQSSVFRHWHSCPFVLFLLPIVLSVLLRYADSDCPFCIFKLFL